MVFSTVNCWSLKNRLKKPWIPGKLSWVCLFICRLVSWEDYNSWIFSWLGWSNPELRGLATISLEARSGKGNCCTTEVKYICWSQPPFHELKVKSGALRFLGHVSLHYIFLLVFLDGLAVDWQDPLWSENFRGKDLESNTNKLYGLARVHKDCFLVFAVGFVQVSSSFYWRKL